MKFLYVPEFDYFASSFQKMQQNGFLESGLEILGFQLR